MNAQDDAQFGVAHLSAQECWDALGDAGIGRLAVVVDGRPGIFPVNYVVHESAVVFRTGEGTKLDAALSGNTVAFEADGRDAHANQAWSVVIHGAAEVPAGIQDVMETVTLPISPWQAGIKSRYLRIVPEEVTGRRFRVQAGS